ncbi:HAMP domain-containing sensor histidine kinase [Thiohalorhabdus sp. Cl-TMA]|uniref:histidine kinase n=1 Tax=Thiohalorhabdus methylotrophus TaxID=3242694 RepID=A0ABV4TXG8_9GAMM
MAIKHPKSLPMLILYGFGVVSLPLIGALTYGAVHVERLAEQSQDAVHQAVRAIQHSNKVIEQVTSMERTGRQYLVLQDKALYQTYKQTHEQFQRTVTRLKDLPLSSKQYQLASELLLAESALFKHVSQAKPSERNQKEIANAFIGLTQKAESLLSRSNDLINREVDILRKDASQAQEVLFWLAASLIPLSLASAALFTVLISKPIREVDHSIRQLGDGNFDKTIDVGGPQDLKHIGEQLDWLRERLRELEQEKTRFLRHVSHELKTPLTAIREGTELMDERTVGQLNEDQLEIMRIIRSSSGQLQRLIEDLLNFSTVQIGPPALNLTSVHLGDLVREVVETHKPATMAKHLTLDIHLDESIQLTADREKLRTIVDNLVSNAVKYSPEGGQLRIAAARSEDEATLDVVDSGPGITAEESQRVFEAFFQGGVQAQGYIKGSGLGLSITREYVNAHRGSIHVVNAEQPGGHLRVTLPLDGQKEAA